MHNFNHYYIKVGSTKPVKLRRKMCVINREPTRLILIKYFFQTGTNIRHVSLGLGNQFGTSHFLSIHVFRTRNIKQFYRTKIRSKHFILLYSIIIISRNNLFWTSLIKNMFKFDFQTVKDAWFCDSAQFGIWTVQPSLVVSCITLKCQKITAFSLKLYLKYVNKSLVQNSTFSD